MENKNRLKLLLIFCFTVLVLTAIAIVVYNKLSSKPEEEGQAFNITNEVKVSTNKLTLSKGENKTFTITVSGVAGIIELAPSNNLVTITTNSNDCNGTRCFYDALTGDATVEYVVTGAESGTSQINVNLTDLLTSEEKQVSGSGVVSVSVK